MKTQTKEKTPFRFFALTFLLSWGLWLPSILAGMGVDLGINATAYTSVTVPIGAFAPLFAALILIVRQNGWQGGRDFLRGAFDFHVKPILLIAAFAIPLAIHAAAHYLAPLLGFPVASTLFPAELKLPAVIIAIPYFLLMLVIGGGQEEFGWRGYAQAPMQKRMGVIPASLVIGFIWGIWHLPLWVMPGDGHATYPYPAFLLMTTSLSVVYGWLYNASKQKLMPVIIFHAMCNTAAPLLPFLHMQAGVPESAYWVYAGINLLAGVIAGFSICRKEGKARENG